LFSRLKIAHENQNLKTELNFTTVVFARLYNHYRRTENQNLTKIRRNKNVKNWKKIPQQLTAPKQDAEFLQILHQVL
jgi:hypothetical protein